MAVTNNIKQKLALAASALLGNEAVHGTETDSVELYNSWNVDVGYLRYSEPDKITVDTYMAMIDGTLSDQDNISLSLVFDTLTGSTPTGALPSAPDTVSGTSGGGGFSSGGSGAMETFDDTRLAINTNWKHEWQRLIRSNVSSYISVEGDYTAIGGGISAEKDTEDRSYTFTAAFGGATDKVSRSNEQTPKPLAESSDTTMFGAGTRNTYDMLLGITKIINPRTAAMLNFSYSRSLGYHTDPYKIINVADSSDAIFTTRNESRPEERERYIVYSKIIHELPSTGAHLSASYRFYTDTWDLNSHTFEGSYSFERGGKHLLAPFGRLYHQTAANFYQRAIVRDTLTKDDLPEFASSDPRLAEMLSVTAGIKYQYKTSSTGSVDLRLGYIHRQYSDAVIDDDGTVFFTLDLGKGFD